MGGSAISVTQAVLTTSWTALAYLNMYGCDMFLGQNYRGQVVGAVEHIETRWGSFPRYDCVHPRRLPGYSDSFYYAVSLFGGFVVLMLYVRSVAMTMFEAYYDKQQAKTCVFRVDAISSRATF